MSMPTVVVLILSTDEKRYLADCIPSILHQSYIKKEIWVINNNSHDGTDVLVRTKFPSVRLVNTRRRLSYPEAYNRLIRTIKKHDLFLLLNADTVAHPKMLERMVKTYLEHKEEKIGLIQPSILLRQDPLLINTVGNAIHFLGFGYCRDYLTSYKKTNKDRPIISVSGAAMLLSRSYFKDVGVFDEEFVRYCEDQNLSWRGLMRGYCHYCSTDSILYHHYDFARRKDKFYHAEKNRAMMLLENYSVKTLMILAPLLLVSEAMVMGYSLLNGWVLQKLKSYWFIGRNIRFILKKRRLVQRKRTSKDKDFVCLFDAEIRTPLVRGPLINFMVNPLFRIFYRFFLAIL